jgi:hypothetical protein
LFNKLSEFVKFAQSFGLFSSLFVDGSFSTDKETPGDVDAVLEISSSAFAGLLAHPKLRDLIAPDAVKKKYEVHLFIEPPNGPMISFFQHFRPDEAIARKVSPNAARGILRVSL